MRQASRVCRRLAVGACLVLATSTVGCQTGPGGWDLASAQAELPSVLSDDLAAIEDLRPYPALAVVSPDSDSNGAGPNVREVELIACRLDLRKTIRVVLDVAPGRIEWSRHAVDSLLSGIDGLSFEVEEAVEPSAEDLGPVGPEGRTEHLRPAELGRMNESPAVIRIVDYTGPRAKGPRGVGDTLVVCAGETSASAERGEVLHAEVRMNASVVDILGEVQVLDAETWTGALLHELGHALGFQGHPRVGRSILVLEHDRLRRAGRVSLAGVRFNDPILSALYRLPMGQILGRRALSAASLSWRVRIENHRSRSRGTMGPPELSVGDHRAQIVWEEEGGLRLRLVFPSWREQIARGKPLIAMPSPATRFRLRAR